MLRAAQWLYGLAVVTNMATGLVIAELAGAKAPEKTAIGWLAGLLAISTVWCVCAVSRIGRRLEKADRHERQGVENSLDTCGRDRIIDNLFAIRRVKVLEYRRLRAFIGPVSAAVLAVVLGVTVLVAQEMKPEVQAAIDQGRYDDAISMLRQEIGRDPGYHLNYYWLGKIFYDLGRFAEAAEQFHTALDKKKNHWESLYYLALSQLKLGQLEEAEKSIKRGLKKAKDAKAQFENAAGLLAMARKDYQEADRAFRRALAENEAQMQRRLKDLEEAPYPPEEKQRIIEQTRQKYLRENAQYHINLGDANYYQGVPALAILEYEKALEVDTGSLEVYYHWAEACLHPQVRDFNCALDKLRIVLTKDSTHAPSWMRAGEIYFKAARSSRKRSERNERYKDAIGSYKRYLELTGAKPDSSNVRVFFELAMAYHELRGYEEAVKYFEQVLSIPFEPRDIYYYYGTALFWTKQYEKAAEMLKRQLEWAAKQDAEEYRPSYREDEIYRYLGDSYFYRKPRDYYTAIEYYKKSLEARPDQKRVLQNLAIGYHFIKRYGEALKYYDQRIALGIDSARCSIYRNAGYCALSIAGGGGGEEEFSLDEEDGADIAETEADMSGIDPNVNYFEKAVGYLEKYLECRPDDIKVLTAVASTYLYQMQDCANGVAAFEKLLARDPKNCTALKSIGFAYFSGEICTKNYTKALGYLLKAYDCFRENGGACSDTEVLLWIAQAYHLRATDPKASKEQSNSDFKNAFEWYGRVLKCDPGNAEAVKGQNQTRFEFN